MNDRIITMLMDIERYFRDLESFGIKSKNDLGTPANYYGVSMVLFSLLNRVIDLAQEIVIKKKMGMPSAYKDNFRILKREGIIDESLLNDLEKLTGLRNMLSHEYYRIEQKDIFEGIKRLKAVRIFLEKIKKAMK